MTGPAYRANTGSRHHAMAMTAVNSMSTLVSIIAGVLILGEPLYWYHYLCGALIMVGVIGLAVAPAKKEFDGKSLGDDM